MDNANKKLISVDEIRKEFISASKKKIRNFMKSYLPVKRIGGRMYVERKNFCNCWEMMIEKSFHCL